MRFTQKQIADILNHSHWHAGLQYYDFLLALTFQSDGSGKREYGEAQRLCSTALFRYQLVDTTHLHFTFTSLVYNEGYESDEEVIDETEASRIVAFELEEGEFSVEEPYTSRVYRYRLRFAVDPFPDTPPDETDPFLTYYA